MSCGAELGYEVVTKNQSHIPLGCSQLCGDWPDKSPGNFRTMESVLWWGKKPRQLWELKGNATNRALEAIRKFPKAVASD